MPTVFCGPLLRQFQTHPVRRDGTIGPRQAYFPWVQPASDDLYFVAQRLSAYAANQNSLDRSHLMCAEFVGLAQFQVAQTPLRRLVEWKTENKQVFCPEAAACHHVEERLKEEMLAWFRLGGQWLDERTDLDNLGWYDIPDFIPGDEEMEQLDEVFGELLMEMPPPHWFPIELLAEIANRA